MRPRNEGRSLRAAKMTNLTERWGGTRVGFSEADPSDLAWARVSMGVSSDSEPRPIDGRPTPRNLVPAIRASLVARLQRLLASPIVARIVRRGSEDEEEGSDVEDGDERASPPIFGAFERALEECDDVADDDEGDSEEGSLAIPVSLDYADRWRGYEKEVIEAVRGTVESPIAFLTDEQRMLLERSPAEFLELEPRPQAVELVSFKTENIGGSERVVELTVASRPTSHRHLRHVAVIPNLVQVERQLDGLELVESASDTSALAPLRALVGLAPPPRASEGVRDIVVVPAPDERLDEYQTECIRKALMTPHFAVIQGPPGSGKTTVIAGIVRRLLERGERVLVVSPTHVAVDNVVEKLAPHLDPIDDALEPRTLPVRYAAKTKKLSAHAAEYWVGRTVEHRQVTIENRVERRLRETVPFAGALYDLLDTDDDVDGPISSALSGVESVICGTPIGILSCDAVGETEPGTFDALIVDEVSKMTLPEFLAIAPKARRWVLVGDPEQLPPYNACEDNAVTLDDVLSPELELVCSVGAALERARPSMRPEARLVVVSAEPARAVAAIRAHTRAVFGERGPAVVEFGKAPGTGVVVCAARDVDDACELLSPSRGRDRSLDPERVGSVQVLVQRGIALGRPEFASGVRWMEAKLRAQARLFAVSFDVYHAQPWSERSGQDLRLVDQRYGLDRYLPSNSALSVLLGEDDSAGLERDEIVRSVAERFAVNAISVYDWLTGIPTGSFDTAPLREIASLAAPSVEEVVRPYVGRLKRQYRMHSSLSRVPRELFYFGEALHDGAKDSGGCRVRFLQVEARAPEGEVNECEAEAICGVLVKLNADEATQGRAPGIMIITPYRGQEALLRESIGALHIPHLKVEICTLDRCQGREAEYVFVSVVRSRSTAFLDMPKRWNVALTRAREGLFLVGNIKAYLHEARRARSSPRGGHGGRTGKGRAEGVRVQMSTLARVIEAYDGQIARAGRCDRA